MSGCHQPACHGGGETKRDNFLIFTSATIVIFYLLIYMPAGLLYATPWLDSFALAIHDLVNTMAWGVILGTIFIGLIGRVPREFVIAMLGDRAGLKGILRATLAGVLLDLCSHGILMVGAKLYERGASTGQVMAFLIASPWNSFSFTLVLWAMVGLNWMLVFLLLSMLIAIVSGLVFEQLEKKKVLPANPNRMELPEGFEFIKASRVAIKNTKFDVKLIGAILWNGLLDSRMVMHSSAITKAGLRINRSDQTAVRRYHW